MSYPNPTINTGGSTGLNAAIESIRSSLAGLSWMEKSFGRAWTFTEMNAEQKSVKIPKVFVGKTDSGDGEYHNVLPNDFLKGQSFIRMDGPEEWKQFNRFEGSMKSRKISVIIWVNLKEIDSSKNYIFTDELKDQVEDLLKGNAFTASMDGYYDEKPEEIFEGYTIDEKSQYLMYPYAGMRFVLTINYPEVCQ